jgi:hypothetical protein
VQSKVLMPRGDASEDRQGWKVGYSNVGSPYVDIIGSIKREEADLMCEVTSPSEWSSASTNISITESPQFTGSDRKYFRQKVLRIFEALLMMMRSQKLIFFFDSEWRFELSQG